MQNSKLLYLILTARSILIVRTYWSVSPKITGKLEREGETQKAKQITKLHSASGKQLESWFSKNLSEVQSCEITLCLLTPTPVACPARISLSTESSWCWYHLQCLAAGCFCGWKPLLIPAFLSSLVDVLYSPFWSEFLLFLLFLPWFCSSLFSPKLHSFLAAFILSFFSSLSLWVKENHAPLKRASCM